MNLKTYLETNNFEKKDLTILFSVGCVLNVKNGDTFPMMDDNTFDFEDGMNVVTDEFDEYWWESLAKWNGLINKSWKILLKDFQKYLM